MVYRPGDYDMVCQRTGNTYPFSEMRKEWNGFWVHHSVWEPRQPQEFVKAVKDNPAARPAIPPIEQTMGETTIIDFCNC